MLSSKIERWPRDDLQRRLQALLTRVGVFNDRPGPLLHLHTTWGTVESFVGWRPQARPAVPPVPPQPGAPTKSDPATPDPLQLLTPGDAARVAQVALHTLRSWDAARRLLHTQHSLGRGRPYAIQDLRAVRPSPRHTGGWETRRRRAAATSG